MSAQVEAVTALCGLATLAGGVAMWAWWPTPRRVQQAQDEARDEARKKRAEEIAAAAASLREEQAALADTSVPANYASGEYPLVPPPRHAAVEASTDEPEYVAEPVVEPAEPVFPWLRPVLDTEPTPIFHSTGSYPVLDLDLSATNSWNRAELLERIRRAEAEAAGVKAA